MSMTVFDSPITTEEVVAVPASLPMAGYIRRGAYQGVRAILAGRPTLSALLSTLR
jgi:hypothetical protein